MSAAVKSKGENSLVYNSIDLKSQLLILISKSAEEGKNGFVYKSVHTWIL
jgi:hypothetical protein